MVVYFGNNATDQKRKPVYGILAIVGEACANDQAWVEGAYCTSEWVLNRYFGIDPIIEDKHYPFLCPE